MKWIVRCQIPFTRKTIYLEFSSFGHSVFWFFGFGLVILGFIMLWKWK